MAAVDDANAAVLTAMKTSGKVSAYGAFPASAVKRGHTEPTFNNEESLTCGGAAESAVAASAPAQAAAADVVAKLKAYFDTLYDPIGP